MLKTIKFIATKILLISLVTAIPLTTLAATSIPEKTEMPSKTNKSVINREMQKATKKAEKEAEVDFKTARKIAAAHIKMVALAEMNEKRSTLWESGKIKLKEGDALIDESGKVVAYYFRLFTNKKIDAGYIVVSASKSNAPVIEYSLQGSNLPALLTEDGTYTIFDVSNTNYQSTWDLYEEEEVTITDDQSETTSVEDQKIESFIGVEGDSNTNLKGTSHETKFEFNYNVVSLDSKRSLATSGFSYSVVYSWQVNSLGNSYKVSQSLSNPPTGSWSITADHSTNNNCGQTAFANIIRYWYTYKGTSNKVLGLWDVSNHGGVMNCVNDYISAGPIIADSMASKMKNYLTAKGFANSAIGYYSDHWPTYTNEIASGRPVLLLLYNDIQYGFHYVTGYGYVEFTVKNSTNTEKYARIADGWSRSSDVYIHWGYDRTLLEMLTINIK